MVDAADHSKIEASRNELHNLLLKPQLEGIPVLVLGNKKDLPGALDEKQLIQKMYAFNILTYRIVIFHLIGYCFFFQGPGLYSRQRNMLLFHILQRQNKYRYYIPLDKQVKLTVFVFFIADITLQWLISHSKSSSSR